LVGFVPVPVHTLASFPTLWALGVDPQVQLVYRSGSVRISGRESASYVSEKGWSFASFQEVISPSVSGVNVQVPMSISVMLVRNAEVP
jgi:hypothetical protein